MGAALSRRRRAASTARAEQGARSLPPSGLRAGVPRPPHSCELCHRAGSRAVLPHLLPHLFPGWRLIRRRGKRPLWPVSVCSLWCCVLSPTLEQPREGALCKHEAPAAYRTFPTPPGTEEQRTRNLPRPVWLFTHIHAYDGSAGSAHGALGRPQVFPFHGSFRCAVPRTAVCRRLPPAPSFRHARPYPLGRL